jgi:hypothetical protein
MNTLATTSPATEKQIAFLIKLLAEKIEDPAQSLAAITWVQEHKLSKATASAKIDEYMKMPSVRKAFSSTPELDEGMYKVGEDIFKVYFTRGDEQRAPQLVTKQLIEGHFEYTGKRPLNFITAEHRMTLDEAKEYGKVTGTCCNCGRLLTNEESIAAGIGPICATKF